MNRMLRSVNHLQVSKFNLLIIFIRSARSDLHRCLADRVNLRKVMVFMLHIVARVVRVPVQHEAELQ